MRAKNQHVISVDGKWAVRGEGNSKATSLHDTQAKAIDAARHIAKNQGSQVIVHRTDGRIKGRYRYGNEPLPPKTVRKVLFPSGLTANSKRAIEKAVHEALQEAIPASAGREPTATRKKATEVIRAGKQ